MWSRSDINQWENWRRQRTWLRSDINWWGNQTKSIFPGIGDQGLGNGLQKALSCLKEAPLHPESCPPLPKGLNTLPLFLWSCDADLTPP